MKKEITALGIAILSFSPAVAWADPSGVVGLVVVAAVVGTLAVLAAGGALVGGVLGGARFAIVGGVAGFAIFLVGGVAIHITGRMEESKRAEEYKSEQLARREACLKEAGEFGVQLGHVPKRVVLVENTETYPALRDPTVRPWIDRKSAPPLIEYSTAMPSQLGPDEAVIKIVAIDRPIPGVDERKLRGIETTVYSGKDGKGVARRLNFNCFPEYEREAIERFARRILGEEVLPFPPRSSQAAVEYPVARFSQWDGSQTPEGAAARELRRQVPTDWGCEVRIGEPGMVMCPEGDGSSRSRPATLVLHDTGSSWIEPSRPSTDGDGRSGRFQLLVVKERDRKGRLLRTLFVRAPDIQWQGRGDIEKISTTTESLEIYWSVGNGLRMTIPMRPLGLRSEPK